MNICGVAIVDRRRRTRRRIGDGSVVLHGVESLRGQGGIDRGLIAPGAAAFDEAPGLQPHRRLGHVLRRVRQSVVRRPRLDEVIAVRVSLVPLDLLVEPVQVNVSQLDAAPDDGGPRSTEGLPGINARTLHEGGRRPTESLVVEDEASLPQNLHILIDQVALVGDCGVVRELKQTDGLA